MDEYTKELEQEVERLRKALACQELVYDLLASKVHIQRTDVYSKIKPKWITKFLEDNGWTMKYEMEHESYKTRAYTSPKKDKIIKIYMKDNNPGGSRRGQIAGKIRKAVETFCELTGRGQLQVVFDIMKEYA